MAGCIGINVGAGEVGDNIIQAWLDPSVDVVRLTARLRRRLGNRALN
tara:strand:- start:107801 stop:107941 length:141 start_codon:yes stop_codon:yes gene_type:complete